MIEGLPEVKTYPFIEGSCDLNVRTEIHQELNELVSLLPLLPDNKFTLFRYIWKHFQNAEKYFAPEEIHRSFGVEGANLFYHGRPHAIFQTTYDAIAISKHLLRRRDRLSRHLTVEGVTSIILGAIYHDTGYVYQVTPTDNHAARTPIHVDISMQALAEQVQSIGLPAFIDSEKVVNLGKLGIYATSFPYTDEVKTNLRSKLLSLNPLLRSEGNIVRLVTQFADLGGQVARCDYFPRGVSNLRAEMNAANPGKGDGIIGLDHELAKKCRGFFNFCVYPMLSKVGNALFGTKDNPYQRAWDKQGVTSQLTSSSLSSASSLPQAAG